MEQALTARPTAARRPDYLAPARYLAHLKGETGRQAMRYAMRQAAALLNVSDLAAIDWAQMTPGRVDAIVSAYQARPTATGEPPAPASVALVLNCLKGICRASWLDGYLDVDAYQRIRAIKAPRGSRLPVGRDIGAGEKAALMDACSDAPGAIGVRDTAIMALLIGTGCRRAEVARLDIDDYDRETDALRIIGKGDKERRVFISNGARETMLEWLAVRGDAPGALFPPMSKGGDIHHDRHMTPTAVHLIVQHAAQAAGVAHLTVHDFRRSCAGDLLDNGVDLATVASVLGHSDTAQTARYDRRGDRAKKHAAGTVHVPYRGRRQPPLTRPTETARPGAFPVL
jgi:integrase